MIIISDCGLLISVFLLFYLLNIWLIRNPKSEIRNQPKLNLILLFTIFAAYIHEVS
jgi:hypothetical protein